MLIQFNLIVFLFIFHTLHLPTANAYNTTTGNLTVIHPIQENVEIILKENVADQNPHEVHQAMLKFYNNHIDIAAYAVGIAQTLGTVVGISGLALQILTYNQGRTNDNAPKVNMAYAGQPGFAYRTPDAEIWTSTTAFMIDSMLVQSKTNTKQSQTISIPKDQELRHLIIDAKAEDLKIGSCLEVMSLATDFSNNYRGFNGVLYFDLPLMIMIHSAFFPDQVINSQGYGNPFLQGCFYTGYIKDAFATLTIDLRLAQLCTLTKKPTDKSPQAAYRRLAHCLSSSMLRYCRTGNNLNPYDMSLDCRSSISNSSPLDATLEFS